MNLKATIDVSGNIPFELFADVKNEAATLGIDLTLTSGKGLMPTNIPPELMVIMLEFVKNVSFSAVYDAIKFLVLSMTAKFEDVFGQRPKNLTFVCNDEKLVVDTNINLSQSNIDQIVNSISERISKG